MNQLGKLEFSYWNDKDYYCRSSSDFCSADACSSTNAEFGSATGSGELSTPGDRAQMGAGKPESKNTRSIRSCETGKRGLPPAIHHTLGIFGMDLESGWRQVLHDVLRRWDRWSQDAHAGWPSIFGLRAGRRRQMVQCPWHAQ